MLRPQQFFRKPIKVLFVAFDSESADICSNVGRFEDYVERHSSARKLVFEFGSAPDGDVRKRPSCYALPSRLHISGTARYRHE